MNPQGNYSRDIPPPPLPAHPHVRFPTFHNAQGIVAGTPRHDVLVQLEAAELLCEQAKPVPEVTAAEKLAYKARKDLVEAEAKASLFGIPLGTPEAEVTQQLLTNLANQVAELVQQQGAFGIQLAGLGNQVAGLGANITEVRALLANTEARRVNNSLGQQEPLQPLRKEVAVVGVAPALLQGHQVAVPNPIPPVGTLPPLIGTPGGIFPVNAVGVGNMTHDDILTLMSWYGDDFRIVPQDLIADRRAKLLAWLGSHRL